MSPPGVLRVGVISDTHGLLRPEAVAALRGSDLILHAGDVGRADILDSLRAIAPVYAVRGNTDGGAWAQALPLQETVEVGGALLHVLHDLYDLALTPQAAGIAAVISGHTHRPKIEERGGVLYVNPGAAGPRRFELPASVAHLTVSAGRVQAHLITLPS